MPGIRRLRMFWSGPQASTAVKTAEAVGEKLGDAYSEAASDGAQKQRWLAGPAVLLRRRYNGNPLVAQERH